MIRDVALLLWDLTKRTFAQWQAHRSAQLAAALAFYGAIAIAGIGLAGLYLIGLRMAHGAARVATSANAAHISGWHNTRIIAAIIREAASRPHGWIALVIGVWVFLVAIAGTAFQLQLTLDIIWNPQPQKERGRKTAGNLRAHLVQLAFIYVLSLILMCLLFAGAALHGLATHSHRLPFTGSVLYQVVDVSASIAVLTLVFLLMFAYLPRAGVPWKDIWIGAFVSAVLYERGQFFLSLYIGGMDARSPYADIGAVLAVLSWLYYSAQVVLIGAMFTKALKERASAPRTSR